MTKTLTTLLAGALLATVTIPQVSAQNNVRDFRLLVQERVIDRNLTNNRAASLISRLIKTYVRRDPGKTVAFARIGNRFLQQTVRANLRGRTALVILRGTARGFLGASGGLDSTFERFVRLIVRKLPNSQKTDSVLRPIADRLVAINLSRGGAQSQSQEIFDLVYGAGGQVPPNVS